MTRPLACVVSNPAKRSMTPWLGRELDEALTRAGYSVRDLPTTPQAPGEAQTRLALESGASLVVAAGGDGTLRRVAGELAGTGVALGVLPVGTANLAARALGLTVGGRRAQRSALEVLTAGHLRPLDLAWARTEPLAEELPAAPEAGQVDPSVLLPAGRWHPFLAVAGIGFDAQLVASTSAPWKERAGWLAYAAAALAHLHGPRLEVELGVSEGGADQAQPQDGAQVERLRARTVLVANGGSLPAGIRLIPGARLDDGLLDVAAIDVRGSLAGWTALSLQVLPPRAGSYRPGPLTQVLQRRGRQVVLRCQRPAPVQVDGDLAPPTHELRVRLEPGVLRVLAPAPHARA